jgi:beta-fructofuranosidase
MQSKIQKATRVLKNAIPKAESDPHRPRYHFLPPANWMNDPNGTIYHNGEYHLFYQFNPKKPKWSNLHWGHAKSKDLVHWEHLPIALAPDGFPGELHCWSGCCLINEDGEPTILYTSMDWKSLLTKEKRYSQQWLAFGSPDLLTWEKYPGNPILSEEIHGDKIPRQWRDPYVWKDGDRWLMVLAGQYAGEKFGSVLLYQSRNLINWDYIGVLSQGTPEQGKGWECPNYFRLSNKYMLVVSPYGPVIYSVGDFDGKRHHSDAWHTLDHGKDFYATNTYLDEQGRTILVGWVQAKGPGWAGCLSLPREIKLVDANQPLIKPIPELEKLRQSHQRFERTMEHVVEAAGTAPLFGERMEIKARYRMEEAQSFGFKVIDDEEEHLISYDFSTHTLQVTKEQAKLQFLEGEDQVELHIFIDHSVIEIFINQREAFTAIFRPKLAPTHALKIAPFVIQGRGYFCIDVWRLCEAPITGSF